MIEITNFKDFKQQSEDKFYVYLHLTKDEEIPFYIGKGNNKRCFSKHKRNKWWNNIVNKHGIIITILEDNLSEKDSFEKEIYWINYFGRKELKEGGTLVNLTNGGEGVSGRIILEEELVQRKERWKENYEQWNKLGNRPKYFGKQLFGKENPNYGNTNDKNPLSKKVVKLSLSGEYIDIYSSAKECSEINNCAPNSVSGCCVGKRHQLKGYKYVYLSDYETGNYKITSGKNSKKVIYKLDLYTNEILKIYNSASETKSDGFNPTNVGQVCLGKKKTHMGYKWVFEKDYE